jgi:hypothetical protein
MFFSLKIVSFSGQKKNVLKIEKLSLQFSIYSLYRISWKNGKLLGYRQNQMYHTVWI